MFTRHLGLISVLALVCTSACKNGDMVVDEPEDMATSRDGSSDGAAGGDMRDGGPQAKRIFITQKKFRGDLMNGGGVTGADAACTAAAQGAQLGGTFKAWISTSTQNAIDRIVDVGPWQDLSGATLFADREGLKTSPKVGIRLDERGQFLPSDRVWTGTQYGGTFDSLNGACKDWTSGSMSDLAKIGQVGRSDGAAWTAFSATTCDQEGHLLCIEQ